jgi:hypothetical protein
MMAEHIIITIYTIMNDYLEYNYFIKLYLILYLLSFQN